MSTSVWDNDGAGSSTGIPVPAPGIGIRDIQELGAGTGLLKTIDTLLGIAYIRTLTAGANITFNLSPDGNELEIASTVTDTYTFNEGSASFHFTASAAQTLFHVTTSISLTTAHVWRNGLKLVPTVDFTVDPDLNDISLVDACVAGEAIEILVTGSFVVDLGVLGNFQQDVEDTAAASAAATAASAAATAAASAAATSAGTATAQATLASGYAAAASADAIAAAASAADAAASYDFIDDIYLGAKASDPTLDNDGDALTDGDFYLNTGSGYLRFYSTGVWVEHNPAGGIWGGITGTLSAQTDLQSALDGKSDTTHNHDAAYSALGHNHDAAYSALGHTHSYLPLAGGILTGTLTATEINTSAQITTFASDGAASVRHWIRNLGSTSSVGAQLYLSTQDGGGLEGIVLQANTDNAYINDSTGAFSIISSGSIGLSPGSTSRFSLDSAGAIALSSSYGTAGQVIKSNGAGVASSWLTLPSFPSGAIVGTTDTQTLTGKTIGLAGALDCNNNVIQEIKTATFNSEVTLSTTSGTININWSAAQNYVQNELTGAVTYTMTDPPGIGHFQLRGISDGTSSAFGITWDTVAPQKIIWYGGAAFTTTTANKAWMVNFFFDGTNYHAMGASEV